MNVRNVIIVLLGLLALVLIARFVVFKDQFDQWGQGLDRVGEWQNNYRAEHPNASDEEVDAAFKAGIADIGAWKEQYKQKHPGATDADADAAFNAAWGKK